VTVAASLKNANSILSDDKSIVEAVRQSIHRLTILQYSESFPVMWNIASNLVYNGAVHELCITDCEIHSDVLKIVRICNY